MNFLYIDKFLNERMNNSEINLFIKNYKKIISNNYTPNNTNNKKILTIVIGLSKYWPIRSLDADNSEIKQNLEKTLFQNN